MQFSAVREVSSGHRAWNNWALQEAAVITPELSPPWGVRGGPSVSASRDSLTQGLADPSSRTLPGPQPPRLQKRYSPPTSGQSGEQREALSWCSPGVRASPSKVPWNVLLPALSADMEIPKRMERWHVYPSPSHAVLCDPLQMHP